MRGGEIGRQWLGVGRHDDQASTAAVIFEDMKNILEVTLQ
jgi:hypothetical protein